jgi:transcriptional regulator with XRE-family HTH domain
MGEMIMDTKMVGAQIARLRKDKGLTQNDLGDRLGVSFQAVSKWERGETLPDTAILLDLANALETSVDFILTGGSQVLHYRGKFTVAQMSEGILSLKRMGELIGKDNALYRHAIAGINEKLNTNIEDAFTDDRVMECFIAEAIIQNLMAGKYIDPTDVKNGFKHEHFRNIVLDHCARYGIK